MNERTRTIEDAGFERTYKDDRGLLGRVFWTSWARAGRELSTNFTSWVRAWLELGSCPGCLGDAPLEEQTTIVLRSTRTKRLRLRLRLRLGLGLGLRLRLRLRIRLRQTDRQTN